MAKGVSGRPCDQHCPDSLGAGYLRFLPVNRGRVIFDILGKLKVEQAFHYYEYQENIHTNHYLNPKEKITAIPSLPADIYP